MKLLGSFLRGKQLPLTKVIFVKPNEFHCLDEYIATHTSDSTGMPVKLFF